MKWKPGSRTGRKSGIRAFPREISRNLNRFGVQFAPFQGPDRSPPEPRPSPRDMTEPSTDSVSEPSVAQPTFADLGLSPEVVAALVDIGYEAPSPIQAQTIPL